MTSDEELRSLWLEYCRLRKGMFYKDKEWNAAHSAWAKAIYGIQVYAGYINGLRYTDMQRNHFMYKLKNGKTYRTDEPL